MVQNQRPFTLHTVLLKTSTVISKKHFTGELWGDTVYAEEQGFRCRRSARREVHALHNLI